MKKFKLRFVLIAALFILTACGGGGGGGSSQQVGQFIDDPVAGLSYSCVNASQTIAGITDNQGNFNYLPGQTCTFKVGNVTLGSPSAIPRDENKIFLVFLSDEINIPTVISIDQRRWSFKVLGVFQPVTQPGLATEVENTLSLVIDLID